MSKRGPLHRTLLCEEITGTVINGFHVSYDRLGFGFLESVYRRALAMELRGFGLTVVEEAPIDVWYAASRSGTSAQTSWLKTKSSSNSRRVERSAMPIENSFSTVFELPVSRSVCSYFTGPAHFSSAWSSRIPARALCGPFPLSLKIRSQHRVSPPVPALARGLSIATRYREYQASAPRPPTSR